MTRLLFIIQLCLLLFASVGLTVAETAPEATPKASFDQAEALVAKGDFEGALPYFARAARGAPGNTAYTERALVIRRVVSMRKYVAKSTVSPRWEKTVLSLHVFYLQSGSLDAALALDKRAHKTLRMADSEARYAETLLEAGRNAEALQLLSAAPAWIRDDRHATYQGIALARQARLPEARKVAKNATLPDGALPSRVKDRARLAALVGDSEGAIRLLIKCFQALPEKSLPAIKASVKRSPDFYALRGTPAYVRAMKTTSKLKAEGCSGGSDCGSCPSRGGCGKKK